MKRYIVKILLITLSFILIDPTLIAQELKSREAQKLLIKIEEGLNNGSVDKFSNYFDERCYISLSSNISGYYSANQSYYVIKDYFSVFKPISFNFTFSSTDTENPFAAGNLKFKNKGIRGNAIVFVTLHYVSNKWLISQITIN
ncbi:MAG: DUF4783 domain-containing protein [Ignavibacteria bacterium]|nr:DUF4783 domain-containing protein [Ignavibacteria bacterium]